MKKTTVINIWGAAGTGKTTLALDLAAKLKIRDGVTLEYVSEFVKPMVYEGNFPKPTEELSVLGAQAHQEAKFYGHVDYIITDSPFGLVGFYMELLHKEKYITQTAHAHLAYLKSQGISHLNFLVGPHQGIYEQEGRLQDQKLAEEESNQLEDYLKKENIEFAKLEKSLSSRVEKAIEIIHSYK